MNAQTWLLNHYSLLEYFSSSQGGPWSKRLCRPYAFAIKGGLKKCIVVALMEEILVIVKPLDKYVPVHTLEL